MKCIEADFQDEMLQCTLTIPNREVRYIFRNIISNRLEESFGNRKLVTMLNALKDAMDQINTRAYAKELEARGFENIIRIVVVSDGKKVWVRTL